MISHVDNTGGGYARGALRRQGNCTEKNV